MVSIKVAWDRLAESDEHLEIAHLINDYLEVLYDLKEQGILPKPSEEWNGEVK